MYDTQDTDFCLWILYEWTLFLEFAGNVKWKQVASLYIVGH